MIGQTSEMGTWVARVQIVSFDIFAVDLPFRRAFRHSAASRSASDSVLVKCTTDGGATGFGECLPRTYVTGESRDSTYDLLRDRILPRLTGMEFASYADVWAFLDRCDGKAPADWVAPDVPQTAAWCAVDLALLDACGHAFGQAAFGPNSMLSSYSGVLTHGPGGRLAKSCLFFRLYGLMMNVNHYFYSATIISSVPEAPYRGPDSGPGISVSFLFLASSAR